MQSLVGNVQDFDYLGPVQTWEGDIVYSDMLEAPVYLSLSVEELKAANYAMVSGNGVRVLVKTAWRIHILLKEV